MVSRGTLPPFHWVVNGWNGSNCSETQLLTPFLATSGRKFDDVPPAWPCPVQSLYSMSVYILHKYFAHTCAMGVSDPLHHEVLEAHCATVKTLC